MKGSQSKSSGIGSIAQRAQIVRWGSGLIANYFVGVGGSFVIGSLLDAWFGRFYHNTGLEPYSPAIAVTAFALGYFLSSRVLSGRAAEFVWILGLLWMSLGIYGTLEYWSPNWSPEKTRWSYVLANLFSPTTKCSDTDCFSELLFTTPLMASVAYSIGAYMRAHGQRGERRSNA